MVTVIPVRCVGCGLCIRTCIHGALRIKGGQVEVLTTCQSCGVCVDCCPRQALRLENQNKGRQWLC